MKSAPQRHKDTKKTNSKRSRDRSKRNCGLSVSCSFPTRFGTPGKHLSRLPHTRTQENTYESGPTTRRSRSLRRPPVRNRIPTGSARGRLRPRRIKERVEDLASTWCSSVNLSRTNRTSTGAAHQFQFSCDQGRYKENCPLISSCLCGETYLSLSWVWHASK